MWVGKLQSPLLWAAAGALVCLVIVKPEILNWVAAKAPSMQSLGVSREAVAPDRTDGYGRLCFEAPEDSHEAWDRLWERFEAWREAHPGADPERVEIAIEGGRRWLPTLVVTLRQRKFPEGSHTNARW